MGQNIFEKNWQEKMLSEQIIEFESRGPGPSSRTCNPTTGYFYKTKISTENLRVDYYLLQAYCTRQCFPYQGQITNKILTQNARF